MSEQLNEMDVYMKKHLEQQRKKKIIRCVCLILAVILLSFPTRRSSDLSSDLIPDRSSGAHPAHRCTALLEQKYCLGGNTASCAE